MRAARLLTKLQRPRRVTKNGVEVGIADKKWGFKRRMWTAYWKKWGQLTSWTPWLRGPCYAYSTGV